MLRRRRFRAAAAPLVACAVLWASAAAAQPAPTPTTTEDAKNAARSLGREGQEALDRKDYRVAAEKFAAADRSFHAPTLVLGLARALAGAGRLVDAREAYDRVVREGAPPGSPPAFEKAVDDARSEGAALGARIPTITIDVVGARVAEVRVDDVVVPTPSLGAPRPIDPGRHVVRATAPGFAPAEQQVSAAERTATHVELRLSPIAEATPAAAPVAPPPAAPAPAPTSAPASTFPWKPLGLGALGLGVVGLAVGGVTGGLAIGKHGTLADACPASQCDTSKADVKSTLDSYHALGTVSTIGFAAGALFAAGGVTLLVLAPPSDRAKAGVAPVLWPGGVGAAGRF
jgi:hypothetical protein